MDIMQVEKILSGNAVLVINEPKKGKNGWLFPCFIHDNAARNGAIENARKTLMSQNLLGVFDFPNDGKGDGNVYVISEGFSEE
jgi:hypothetical protein